MKKLIDEIKVAVIFDGTNQVCEAMEKVLRFVDETWCIKQRVAKLLLLAKNMNGDSSQSYSFN